MSFRYICIECREDLESGICICGICGPCTIRREIRRCFCERVLPEVHSSSASGSVPMPNAPEFDYTPQIDLYAALISLRRYSRYKEWYLLPAIPRLRVNVLSNLEHFRQMYIAFFEKRGVMHLLAYVGLHATAMGSALHFAYINTNDDRRIEDDVVASHGTCFPFLRSILLHGGLIPSRPHVGAMRAANYGEGIYCSPSQALAYKYAVPQIIFNDGVFHKVVVSLAVSQHHPSFKECVANREWKGPEGVFKMIGIYIYPNTGAQAQEPRLLTWQSSCEPNVHI